MGDQAESLDSIFSNAEAPAEPVEQPRDEGGKFAEEPKHVEAAPIEAAKPAEVSQVEPAAPTKEPVRPEVAAIIDERRKRQSLERELQELKAKAEPKPDFWENPEQATAATVRQFIDPMRSENFELRMQIAELKYPDFGEAVKAFLEVAQNDPTLTYQIDHAPNPIDFAYREGKRLKELAPYGGDFTKYREAVTGQLKGEISTRDERIKALEAQLAEAQKSKTDLEAIPRSLNKGTEAAPRSKAEADDDDIGSIVRFNRKS